MNTGSVETADDPRLVELSEALRRVRARIAAACAAAGRHPEEILLLPVTKYFPVDDVVRLARLGVTEFAENRHQEAAAKAAELTARLPGVNPRWHMVGGLQRNKARAVLDWAKVVQSVDDIRLVEPLARAAAERGADGPIEVLLQLSLDGDPNRGGCVEAGLPALAEAVAARDELRLAGLMTVAPLGLEPDEAFAGLRRNLRALQLVDPHATVLSAGMSADLDSAIRNGSTCVRVGTAVLGDRRLASQVSH